MTRATWWISVWGAIGLLAAGCARRGDEPTEVRRGALDPEDSGTIAGTVTWRGEPVGGLASQSLVVFVEGEAFLAINSTNGTFQSPTLPAANYFVSVQGPMCPGLPIPVFARVPVTIVSGVANAGTLDITGAVGKVIGTVTTEGLPLAHPSITLDGTCQTLPSDGLGQFEGFLSPGTYTGHAGVGTSSLETFSFDVVAGQTTDLQGGAGTPAGSDVTVELRGGLSQLTGVSVTFSQVLTAGRTAVPYFQSVDSPPPDGAFYIPGGHAWDIRTTATTSGPVRVCIHYNQNDSPPPESATILLRHRTSGAQTNVTTSLDTVNDVICGVVDSLFALTDTELDVGVLPAADGGADAASSRDAGTADAASIADAAGAADAASTADAGSPPPDALAVLAPIGTACLSGSECASGFCADGRCCETACAGGSKDCQACSIAEGSSADGVCSALPQCTDAPVASCTSSACPTIMLPGPNSATDHITITFPSPLGAGDVSARPCGAVAAPTNGYEILTNMASGGDDLACLDLEVSATYSGSVEVCVYYTDELLADGMGGTRDPSTFELWHDDGSGFQPITTYRVDATADHGPGLCGNVDTFSPFAIVAPIDTTPPAWRGVPTAPIVSYATSTASVVVNYPPPTAVDATDGLVAVSCLPAPGSQFPPGRTTVNCTAAHDRAGNAAPPVSFTVWVQYQAPSDGAFFLPPINADGSSRFNRGSTIPTKFKLSGASAAIKNLVAHLAVAKVKTGAGSAYAPAESTPACGDTFRYDATAKQYVFNLSTKGMAAGTWSLRADLGDGVDHSVKVSLK